MAMPTASAFAKSLIKRVLLHSAPKITPLRSPISIITAATYSTLRNRRKSETNQRHKYKRKAELLVKRRTRSDKVIDEEGFSEQFGNGNSPHVPVMLGEVIDVFASVALKSFVDCTLGAGGHSAAIILAHPEMETYVGLDVDPVAHQIAQDKINNILQKDLGPSKRDLQVHTLLKNFRTVKAVLHDIDGNHLTSGVQGVLMDLGMSSMQVNNAERGFSLLCDGPLDMRMNPQASLKAEDILNSWPDDELGKILRDYGEESNWFSLQKKIVKARLAGGLHSTNELVDLIRSSSSWSSGRQGWIKTATRVFQALRIAVNDELNILKESIHSCFDSLGPGGRLAIISFHSLEDRVVKQAFLDIINRCDGGKHNSKKMDSYEEKEAWIKQTVQGQSACILTKRPITPSESEERLNPRSRSAKLRVIEKI